MPIDLFSTEGTLIAVLASLQFVTLLATGIVINHLLNKNDRLEKKVQEQAPEHLSAFYMTKEDIDTSLADLAIKLDLNEDQYNEIARRTVDAMTEDVTDQIKYTLEAMQLYRPYSLQRELDEPEDTKPSFEG